MTALPGGLDQLGDPAFLFESAGSETERFRIVYANRAFSHLLGQPACDLLDRPLGALFPSADAALGSLEREAAEAPVRLEVELERDAQTLTFELSLYSVRDETREIRHWFGLLRDVTNEREDLERQRLVAVELLAAGMAHEVNNPLASITTNLEWLMMQLPNLVPATPSVAGEHVPSAICAALVDALVGAERIESTIRYLSMLSGLEDARRELLDVRTLLDAAMTELEGQISGDVNVVRQYDDVPPVMASEQRLKQAFVNLVLNAMQAIDTQSSERSLTLRVLGGERVRVEVEDTGGGVAPALEQRLFSPFVTTKPPGLGKGLGLFLCRRILEAAGGRVGFTSRRGQGSTFWVELPPAS